jgi:hypothetical protein
VVAAVITQLCGCFSLYRLTIYLTTFSILLFIIPNTATTNFVFEALILKLVVAVFGIINKSMENVVR